MQPSLEKLRKFFRLEHQNGYENSAVIGGLSNMLNFWEGEARADNIDEAVIQAVVQRLRSYEKLTPESRADALQGLWKRIQETYPDDTKNTPRAKRETSPGESSVSPPTETREKEKQEKKEARQTTPPPPRSESAPGGKTSATPSALNADLTVLQGVGPRHAQTLQKLGLHTLGDMLYNFPRRYEDYSQLKPIKGLWYGEQVTVIGAVQSVSSRAVRGGKMQLVEAIISDGTGALRLSWFNQPWIANRLKKGASISVSGKIEQYLGRLVMNNPDWEPIETENLHTNRMVPK